MKPAVPPGPPVAMTAQELRALLPALEGMPDRPCEVLAWVVEGKPCRDIVTILGIGKKTVETYLHRIYDCLGVEGAHGACAAVHHALEDRLRRELASVKADVKRLMARLDRAAPSRARRAR